MHWNKMQVTISDDEGRVYAIHEIDRQAARRLHTAAGKAAPHAGRTTRSGEPHDLLHSLETAADNVRRGAVTDDADVILSERAG